MRNRPKVRALDTMQLCFEGKKYILEAHPDGIYVAVAVRNGSQHPYCRWLPRDGKRAKLIVSKFTTVT